MVELLSTEAVHDGFRAATSNYRFWPGLTVRKVPTKRPFEADARPPIAVIRGKHSELLKAHLYWPST